MMGPALMLFAAGTSASGEGEQEIYAAPSGLSVYEYQGGTKYGIQWVNGNNSIPTQVYRDDVLFVTRPAGVNTMDVGVKTGTHTWKVRHAQGNSVSAFSASLSTSNGAVN